MKKIIAFASAAVLGLGVAACDGANEEAAEEAAATDEAATMSDEEAAAVTDEGEGEDEEASMEEGE